MSHPVKSPSRRQAGVGIVTAIFLLVVLAGLGTAMVGLYATQQSSADLDLQGARAYQAARSGLEWGLFQQQRGNRACDGSDQVVAMPAGTSLSGFTTVVRCTATPSGAVAAGTMRLCEIRATACNIAVGGGCATAPNNTDYVRRVVEAELTCTQ